VWWSAAGAYCKIACRSKGSDSAVWSQIRAGRGADFRTLRVPSDPPPSLPNTCSPRRPPAARRSARCASWCARPWTRPRRSRRWVRQASRSGFRPGPPPPPRASIRTAGHSVVTRAGAGRDRSRHAHRSASRRYPISRHGAPDHPARRRPVWEDGHAAGHEAPMHLGRLRAARALGAARFGWTAAWRPAWRTSTAAGYGGDGFGRGRRVGAGCAGGGSPRARRRRVGSSSSAGAPPRARRPARRLAPCSSAGGRAWRSRARWAASISTPGGSARARRPAVSWNSRARPAADFTFPSPTDGFVRFPGRPGPGFHVPPSTRSFVQSARRTAPEFHVPPAYEEFRAIHAPNRP
jgi:hypothetical protein